MLCIIFSLLKMIFLLRTAHSYNYQVFLLNGPMAKENSITYGITCNSPLNQIDNFHVTNSQLPQDVMHVLLEGMLPLETKLMINSFLALGFFTLNTFNQRCKYFACGRAESRNKPPNEFLAAHFSAASSKLHLSGMYYRHAMQVSIPSV